jgi:hypothetical protein
MVIKFFTEPYVLYVGEVSNIKQVRKGVFIKITRQVGFNTSTGRAVGYRNVVYKGGKCKP